MPVAAFQRAHPRRDGHWLTSATRSLSDQHPINLLTIQVHPIIGMKFHPRFLDGSLYQPRVLWPLVAVDPRRHVPGLLIAEAARLAKRHVVLDERRSGIDAVHAGPQL